MHDICAQHWKSITFECFSQSRLTLTTWTPPTPHLTSNTIFLFSVNQKWAGASWAAVLWAAMQGPRLRYVASPHWGSASSHVHGIERAQEIIPNVLWPRLQNHFHLLLLFLWPKQVVWFHWDAKGLKNATFCENKNGTVSDILHYRKLGI